MNEANYQIEVSHMRGKVSRYDLEQIEDQITFEDRQNTIEMEMEDFNRSPNCYNNRKDILVVNKNELGNHRDVYDQYAKNIIEDKYLVNDYQWNVEVETNEDKNDDDDEKWTRTRKLTRTRQRNQARCSVPMMMMEE